jgi:hypothetical protein
MEEQIPPVVQSTEPAAEPNAYNVVSDTVTGANLRVKDNVYQALAIVISLVLGVAIGALATTDRITGAALGGFAGLLVGLFGSGFFLMVYRAIQHARGRHG